MDIMQLHRNEYEASPEAVVRMPGVVRLLGEHTLDADGAYLALPYDRELAVAIGQRRDASLRFFAADLSERKRTNMSNLKYKREDRWANYLKAGVAAYFEGRPGAKGFNLTISGDIPMGLGLGSANALLCAAIKAAAILAGGDLSPGALEATADGVVRDYFERPPRPGEFSACFRAEARSFSFIDAKLGRYERIDYPLDDVVMMVTDSKVPRPSIDNELRVRSHNLQRALAALGPNQRGLRAYGLDDLDEYMGIMPENVRRHATFFIEEHQRAKDAADALRRGDRAALARILNKSQAGLRNYYELSCPEIDWLVKRAIEIDGVLASRMIGKGFGGCTLTLLMEDAIPEYRKRLEEYERIFGFRPAYWELRPWAGPAELA